MKQLCTSLALLLAFSLHLSAAPLSDQLPQDVLLHMQVKNYAELAQKISASPLGQSMKSIDWTSLLLSLASMDEDGAADAEEAMDEDGNPLPVEEQAEEELEPEEIRKELERFQEKWKEIHSHFSGQSAFVMGDLSEWLALNTANEALREKLYENVDWDADEDPAFAIAEKKEAEMDLKEAQVMLKNFLYMAEVNNGDALLAKMSDWAKEALQEQDADEDPSEFVTRDWGGLTVYTFVSKPDEDASAEEKALLALEPYPWWTVSNGVLYLTLSETALQTALERQKNPPAASLSTLPAYIESLAHLGDADMLFFLNLPRLHTLFRPLVVAAEAELDPADPSPIKPMAFYDWLALDSLLPYVMGLRVDDLGIHSKLRMGFSRESALSRLLVDPSEAAAPRPLFLHKNIMQMSTGHWSLPRFYETFERELNTLSPQIAAGLGMGRAFATAQIGFDFKTQLLDHLGSGFVFVQDIDPAVLNRMLDLAQKAENEGDAAAMMEHQRQNPTNGQYYLIGFEVKNRDALSGTLNTLIGKVHPAGAPAPEDYKGQALHFPMPDMGEMGPSPRLVGYTFLDDYLLISIGNPALLRQAVDASQDPASRLWGQPDFLAMSAIVPPGGQMMDYSSGRAQESAIAVLQRSLGMLTQLQGGDPLPDFSPLATATRQAINTAVRKGLVFELSGFIEFGKAP